MPNALTGSRDHVIYHMYMTINVLPPISWGGGQEDLVSTRGCHSPPGGGSVLRKIDDAAVETANR